MYNLREGSACYWCGLPTHRDPSMNWDRRALHADHTQAIANGGTHPDRLIHDTCNKQRGNGDFDDQRPASLGVHPSKWTKSGRAQTLPPVITKRNPFTWD